MRSVTYISVVNTIAGFLGWDPNNLSTDENNLINRAINRRFQFGREAYFWPELTPLERRTFRPSWLAATAFTAGQETYYPASKKYYCALTANTNQPPADANCSTNLAFWADSAGCYSADNYAATTAYAQGARVYYPLTDTYYQLFAAASTGNLPTDTTRWGALVPFVRNVDYNQAGKTAIGDVKAVWDLNPRTDPTRAQPVKFLLEDDGVRALGSCPVVWLEFRTPTPSLTGASWASGNYNAGDQVYYNGDYYVALQTVAGQDPTQAAYWAVIPVPYVISKYVANGAFADVDGKTEQNQMNFPSENDEAYAVLQFEFDKLERQQGQTTQLNVQ